VKEKKANPLLDPEPLLVQPPDPSTIPLPQGFIQVIQQSTVEKKRS